MQLGSNLNRSSLCDRCLCHRDIKPEHLLIKERGKTTDRTNDSFHGSVFVDWKLDDMNLTVEELEFKELLKNERRKRSFK